MRQTLIDFSALDADIERQLTETQVVAELVKAAVAENASTAQSQEAYLQKYTALTSRYEAAATELERLQKLRTHCSQQDQAIRIFKDLLLHKFRQNLRYPINLRITALLPFPLVKRYI